MTAHVDIEAGEPCPAPARGPEQDDDDAEPPGRPAARLVVDVVVEGGDWSAFEPLAEAVGAAADAAGAHPAAAVHLPATATVAFDSDASVRRLNRTYRGLDKATNVLSFPALPMPDGGPPAVPHLGDIVLADATLTREAMELGIPPRHHLLHLVVHGLLHLMGYDHEEDDEAEVMESLETAILATLGVADPYVRGM
jgi:probable rRNA maturation factor